LKKTDLAEIFYENTDKIWESFWSIERKLADEAIKAANTRDEAKLKMTQKQRQQEAETMSAYRTRTTSWTLEVQSSEQKSLQRQVSESFVSQDVWASNWGNIKYELERERSLWGPEYDSESKWKLDFVEGRMRMRTRLRRRKNLGITYLSKSEKLQLNQVCNDAGHEEFKMVQY
jgi:hypothetical protein